MDEVLREGELDMKRAKYFMLSAAALLLFSWNVSAATIMTVLTHDAVGVQIGTGAGGTWGQAAGMFTVQFDSSPATDAYCVDLFEGVGYPLPQSYPVELLTLDQAGTTTGIALADDYRNAAWLMNAFSSAADTAEKKAGLQVAIWEVLYDGLGSLDLAAGNILLGTTMGSNQGVGSAVDGFANGYLAALTANGQATGLDWFRVAYNDGRQDQLVAPIPAAVWLFGSGLLGVLGFGRKKQS